jgi:hypothetical protein
MMVNDKLMMVNDFVVNGKKWIYRKVDARALLIYGARFVTDCEIGAMPCTKNLCA